MEKAIEQAVRRRAKEVCEYCHMPQRARRARFHVDHIIAKQHGGLTSLENLALACRHCNLHKGTNLSGIDPATGAVVRLFNPRQDAWADHFAWEGPRLAGWTPEGRATVEVLALNSPPEVEIRSELVKEGLFPPEV